MAVVYLLVEGSLDEAVGKRLLTLAGHICGVCHGKQGSDYIRRKVGAFNQSAYAIPYLALVDFMDTGSACPPKVVNDWLPSRHARMLLRVVVREIESWLLADAIGMADFLKVPVSAVPPNPEQLQNPKQVLVNLARRSSSHAVRLALVPEVGSRASVGKLYGSEMARFVENYWNPNVAQQHSVSLERCIQHLSVLS